jgi:hypothetical protein
MRFTSFLAGLCLVASAAPLVAQQGPPPPGPEVKRLAVFEGKWTGEAEMKPSAYGPGGKMASTDDCSWADGGYQLVCKGKSTGAMGNMSGTNVMGWNAEEKAYKFMGYDSMGMMTTATGTLKDKTWTWTSVDKMNGKTLHSRYTIVETSPTSYTFKWEASEDGKTYNVLAEGKSTKAK